jgi:ribosome-associated protein
LIECEQVRDIVVAALEEMKAVDIQVLDVRKMTSVTDFMVIASGNSNRHVKAVANNVIEQAKKHGYRPVGVEGEREAQWVLVDLGDAVVHVMLPKVREFYQLEKLWSVEDAASAGAEG